MAWETLSAEKRDELYGYLPTVPGAHNIDAHPMSTALRAHIEEEIRVYQTDLNDGKETKKWREDAIKAGRERSSGAWDTLREQQREEEWGKRSDLTLLTQTGFLTKHDDHGSRESKTTNEEVRVTEKEAREEANKKANAARS